MLVGDVAVMETRTEGGQARNHSNGQGDDLVKKAQQQGPVNWACNTLSLASSMRNFTSLHQIVVSFVAPRTLSMFSKRF